MKRLIVLLLCLCLSFASAETITPNNSGPSTPVYNHIDVDVSQLNSIMAFGQLFDILANPANYANKVIKIKGQFSSYFDDIQKKTYYVINVMDDTGCCNIGVEFILKNNEGFKYPNEGTPINITGTYVTYTENGNIYATLKDSVMEVLNQK